MRDPNPDCPRRADDARMHLYFDRSGPQRKLRWYVRLSRKGRRIGIAEQYGTPEFDAAFEAAVKALGGTVQMRRLEFERHDGQPERRYLHADVSHRGQLRYYVQLRDKLPKIRIRGEYGSEAFNREVEKAIVEQISLYGNETDYVRAQKQRSAPRKIITTPPVEGTLRWYWVLYKASDHWLGCEQLGLRGFSESTRTQRTGLIESLLEENGEKPFSLLTRDVVRTEMKLRTPTQAGNLLSALRAMIRWMIDAGHLKEEDDPTVGLKSGKSRASRESGGWVPWTDEDMAKFRQRWPLGTMARLMFDILHYTFLRVGDAAQFGPKHLQPMVRQTVVQIATEKSQGRTTVTVPVHPDFAASLRAARAAGILGEETFTGKIVKGKTLPIGKKSWAKKFKTYAILAGVNQPKKNCHGVRKARAEVAAYAECTEAQMMAMFGWTDPKMPAHYIAKARREKLGITGMQRIVAYDQSTGSDLLSLTNGLGTGMENKVVTIPPNRSNFLKKAE
ncbi:tyrosine-type recombinase/integrase [Bradyrhizobium sp. Leo121]|uniref:tyrosine-type recombinase/integrase n=1 Tax=Bradyrhizobium sp. Leo121 TaxID=1571195 RepID=UPI001029FF59|nr:tyrosine-type recombinase/integrase [Bradyrhizobium sp. Leo121]RZN30461.1 hypothetical protein CWO90_20200 [Bradyrhizobium sp. Leo121]